MRNRMRRKYGVKKDRLTTFFAFFVVAPFLAIVLGFAVVKFLIVPAFLPTYEDANKQITQDNVGDTIDEIEQGEYLSNEEEQDTQVNSTKINQSKIDGITLYNIQVGNFNSEENANNLISELSSKEMLGYLAKLNSYKVFAGTYLSKEEADKYLLEVRNSYEDAFINTFSSEERVLNYNSDEENSAENLIEIINEIDKAYSEEINLWNEAVETGDMETLNDKMNSNSNSLKILTDKVDRELESESLQQLLEEIENYISERNNIISSLKDSRESLIQNYSTYNKSYYELLSFTK